jgi:lipoprotein-anchoring transpeptidase ErfK/SrfK
MSMQRIVIPVVLSVFALTPAKAEPLDLSPQSQAGTAYAQSFPARQQAPSRSAQNYGGGFFEMLFGGPGRPQATPQYYAPPPQPDPRLPAYFRQPQLDPQSGSQTMLEPPTRRSIEPRFLPQEVSYSGRERPGTIVINTRERYLFLVQSGGRAMRYGIGVGRPGFAWAGVHHITNKREWPDWTPPDEMLQRRPDLPRHMEGGPDNPLGARAMYLGSTLYRIHGSNEPWTIGQAVSSGCIRMRNEDVTDLYNRVKVGTKVVVI